MLLGNQYKPHCRCVSFAGLELGPSSSQTCSCTSIHSQQLVHTLFILYAQHSVAALENSSSLRLQQEIGAQPAQRPEFMMQMLRYKTLTHPSRISVVLQCYSHNLIRQSTRQAGTTHDRPDLCPGCLETVTIILKGTMKKESMLFRAPLGNF